MPPTDEIISELRSALAHLDDPAYLETHPLARRSGFIAQAPALSRGQLLRRTLRLAIEALDPGADTARNAPEARSYEVLHRYAIGKQSMVAIAAGLDVSERQAYRELRRATEALAQILSELAAGAGEGQGLLGDKAPTRAAKVREEVERLSRVSDQEVDVAELVASAVASAQCLAREHNIEIDFLPPDSCLKVVAQRVMLRQAVLNLLSHMVNAHQGQHIAVRLEGRADHAILQLTYHPRVSAGVLHSESPYAVATELFHSLGLRWTSEGADDGHTWVSVYIPLARERTVLIVDDNEGLIALFRRYLRHTPYRVLTATNAQQALEALAQAGPDIVLLDVMMADQDGWEVLQTLRAQEAGRHARVIVCSIINDPQLSAALGAHGFLHKPVDQAGLLQALADVIREERRER